MKEKMKIRMKERRQIDDVCCEQLHRCCWLRGGAAIADFKGDKRNKSQTLGVTAFGRVAYKHVCNFSE